jgi:hypothetical protein
MRRPLKRELLSKIGLGLLLSALSLTGAALELHASDALPSCREAWAAIVRSNGHRFNYEARESYASWLKRTDRAKCRKDWAVLVYMSAENDLAPYALWDLYEMEAGYLSTPNGAGSTIGNDVLVQLDFTGENGLKRYHVFQTPELYEQKSRRDFDGKDERIVQSPVVATVSERDGKSQAERFQDFLDWAAANYPADRYFVIAWGHGKGWNGKPGEDLEVPAIEHALNRLSKRIGKPVDVFAADACLMQTVEVAYELSRVASYIVGSAQIQSYLGLPYRRLLHELNTGRFAGLRPYLPEAAESELLALMIPMLFRQSMNPKLGLQGMSDPQGFEHLTSSALDSQGLRQELAPALGALGTALREYLREDPVRAMDLQVIASKTPGYEGGGQDLGVFLALLQAQLEQEKKKSRVKSPAAASLSKSVAKTQNALSSTLVNFSVGSKYDAQEFKRNALAAPAGSRRGVSIFIPGNSRTFNEQRARFAESDFYRDFPSWESWLDTLY